MCKLGDQYCSLNRVWAPNMSLNLKSKFSFSPSGNRETCLGKVSPQYCESKGLSTEMRLQVDGRF